jgi:hypothetical protein
MVDRNGARALVVKYHADRDERLVQLLGRALQYIHGGETLERVSTELLLINEMIDSYENLGRFDEADKLRDLRVLTAAQHRMLKQAHDNDELIQRSELAAFPLELREVA